MRRWRWRRAIGGFRGRRAQLLLSSSLRPKDRRRHRRRHNASARAACTMTYQLYRNTTLGNTLQESLDELIQVSEKQETRWGGRATDENSANPDDKTACFSENLQMTKADCIRKIFLFFV